MANKGSLAKYNEQRAAEYAAKRAAAGLPPRKKYPKYIDETMTPEMREYDRAVRLAARQRELARQQRHDDYKRNQQILSRQVAELRVRPFYSTEWER